MSKIEVLITLLFYEFKAHNQKGETMANSNNRNDLASNENSFWQTLETPLRVIGFTADIIAIITVLYSSNNDTETPLFISPHFAIAILVLSTFLYFGYLHSYWFKNKDKYNANFGLFITEDLIYNFQSPFHLFPIVLIIVLFYLIVIVSNLDEDPILMIVAWLGGLALLVGIGATIAMKIEDLGKKSSAIAKSRVIDNWEFWEKQISLKIKDTPWLSVYDFEDSMIAQNIDKESVIYALAHYAMLHSEETEYGVVYSSDTNDQRKWKALKNKENYRKYLNGKIKTTISADDKQLVDRNWEIWENSISQKIEGSLWVSNYDFEELKVIENVSDNSITYALAKYARLHPNKTIYDKVFDEEKKDFLFDHYVLKNVELLNQHNTLR